MPRTGRLDTIAAVRRELARIYRATRIGKIPTGEATRLTYMLMALARLIEQGDFEARLAALEARHDKP